MFTLLYIRGRVVRRGRYRTLFTDAGFVTLRFRYTQGDGLVNRNLATPAWCIEAPAQGQRACVRATAKRTGMIRFRVHVLAIEDGFGMLNEAVEKVSSWPHRAVNQNKYQGQSGGM